MNEFTDTHHKDMAILIAAYNEGKHIARVLKELQACVACDIFVVDDGSSDNTIAEVRGAPRVNLLPLPINGGKGKALRHGFEQLISRGYQWVLIMDGDGQHLPKEASLFISKTQGSSAGVVNGNRFHDADKMPVLRRWTNRFMSWLVSFIGGRKVYDVQCGYKMLSAKFLKEARLSAEKFEIEDDILLEAMRLGYDIEYVPISVVYANEISHIHPWRDTMRFFRFIFEWKRVNSRLK